MTVHDTDPLPQPQSTVAQARRQLEGREILAAAGALLAAVAPAVMATADGQTLRDSVSAYWDVDPRYLFWLPFTAAAGLLLMDGVLSFDPDHRRANGSRWFNIVLGVALLMLTWFNVDEQRALHLIGAYTFFVLFIVVIAYTSTLARYGRLSAGRTDSSDPTRARVVAEISLVFLVLLVLTLVAWLAGLVSFFFFEVFALVNFALYYVQGMLAPFPYGRYEFPWPGLNGFLRAIQVMR